MRILLVVDHLGTGGAQRQLVNLGAGLRDLGHEIEFFTYYTPRDLAAPLYQRGIPIWEARKRSRFSLRVVTELRRRLTWGGYDVALSYLDTPNLYLEIAAQGRTRTKVIVSQRAQYSKGRLPMLKRVQENFHRVADHVVVNSACQMRRMEEEFPWLRRRVSTIWNGVDDQFFRVERSVQSGRRLRLLVVSTVVPLKNANGLIEAMHICREQADLSVEVWWAGRHADMQYVSAMQERLGALRLDDAWKWLGQRTDIPELMAQCDAAVHPSHSEGCANAVCEALAAGLPVLAGRIGDHEMLVEQPGAGILFDPSKPQEIAVAIRDFAERSTLDREAMGTNARAFARQHLSMLLCVHRYETLFSRVIDAAVDICAA